MYTSDLQSITVSPHSLLVLLLHPPATLDSNSWSPLPISTSLGATTCLRPRLQPRAAGVAAALLVTRVRRRINVLPSAKLKRKPTDFEKVMEDNLKYTAGATMQNRKQYDSFRYRVSMVITRLEGKVTHELLYSRDDLHPNPLKLILKLKADGYVSRRESPTSLPIIPCPFPSKHSLIHPSLPLSLPPSQPRSFPRLIRYLSPLEKATTNTTITGVLKKPVPGEGKR